MFKTQKGWKDIVKCFVPCLQADKLTRVVHCVSRERPLKTDTEEKKLLNKVILFGSNT